MIQSLCYLQVWVIKKDIWPQNNAQSSFSDFSDYAAVWEAATTQQFEKQELRAELLQAEIEWLLLFIFRSTLFNQKVFTPFFFLVRGKYKIVGPEGQSCCKSHLEYCDLIFSHTQKYTLPQSQVIYLPFTTTPDLLTLYVHMHVRTRARVCGKLTNYNGEMASVTFDSSHSDVDVNNISFSIGGFPSVESL